MERKNTQSTNRDGLLLRSEPKSGAATTSSDFVLQWGNRKRLRCMKKVQVKDPSGSGPVQRVTARRVVRSDLNHDKDPNPNQQNNNGIKSNGGGNGYLNLRQRPASPSHRILRNCESSIVMRSQNNNEKKGTITTNNNNNSKNHHSSGGSGSSETGGDKIAAVWPPKFVIGLTNKEKEEDFMAIKGSKLPHRPKKRAKFIQRTVNLVSPGAWLCDLTLERYEVREKKVIKKRPRGLKSMGNMDSESE